MCINMLAGATNVLQSATEKLLDAKGQMEVNGYHRQVDNKARETHHLVMQDLREIQRVSGCYFLGSGEPGGFSSFAFSFHLIYLELHCRAFLHTQFFPRSLPPLAPTP